MRWRHTNLGLSLGAGDALCDVAREPRWRDEPRDFGRAQHQHQQHQQQQHQQHQRQQRQQQQRQQQQQQRQERRSRPSSAPAARAPLAASRRRLDRAANLMWTPSSAVMRTASSLPLLRPRAADEDVDVDVDADESFSSPCRHRARARPPPPSPARSEDVQGYESLARKESTEALGRQRRAPSASLRVPPLDASRERERERERARSGLGFCVRGPAALSKSALCVAYA